MRIRTVFSIRGILLACLVFTFLSGFSSVKTVLPAQIQQNLLQNGDFENGVLGLGLTGYALSGWTIWQGTVDVIPNALTPNFPHWHQAAKGSKSLELIGTPGVGGIAQYIQTEIGKKYVFTGAISHHPYVKESGVWIWIDNKWLTTPVIHQTANSESNMRWERFSIEFIAQSARTLIGLLDQNRAGWDWGGAVVDDLSILLAETTPSPAVGYVGQILTQTGMELSQDIIAKLSPQHLATLKAQGVTILDKELVSAPSVAARHWVKVGAKYYETDKDGNFEIQELPQGEKIGYLFQEKADPKPIGQFELSNLVPKGQVPKQILLSVRLIDLAGMDSPSTTQGPEEEQTSQHHAHPQLSEMAMADTTCELWEPGITDPINNAGGNLGYYSAYRKSGCCLDYNGILMSANNYIKYSGKGVPPTDFSNSFCAGRKQQAFLGSDCFAWSYGFHPACKNEGAFVKGGPGCWKNHKYRNCQQMDVNGFKVTMASPFSGTTAPIEQETTYIDLRGGGVLYFVVTNTTPANETTLTINHGNVNGSFFVLGSIIKDLTGSGTFQIPNYVEDETSLILLKNVHVDTNVFYFITPQAPNGASYKSSFSVEAYGKKRTFNITVL